MQRSECVIVVVPGLGNSGPEHWQTRWLEKLSNAVRVHQAEWNNPKKEDWVTELVHVVEQADKPVVLISHSLGTATVAHAAKHFPHNKVAGGFLVSPPDVDNTLIIEHLKPEFGNVPLDPLPFPSLVVASRNDPYCRFERAEEFSYAWGAQLVDAGDAGHINSDFGYGPWPEGILRFAGFLNQL